MAAVQTPRQSFVDPALRRAVFEANQSGIPQVATGQTAVVFFAELDGDPVAVRCFTAQVRDGRSRYAALDAYRRSTPIEAFAWARWHESAIAVTGAHWPVLLMERLDGPSMWQFAHDHLTDAPALRELAEQWRETVAGLTRAGVAHADLQPYNVRVTAGRRPRLVDLDSVWLPDVAGLIPNERGHRHFQHPERLRTGHWDRHVDAFSALVIYLSLRALAADPALWEYNNDENLIFTDEDFQNLGATLWRRLEASPDLAVRDLVPVLAAMCRHTVRVATDLETLVRTRKLPSDARQLPTDLAVSAPWWEEGPTQEPATVWLPPEDPESAPAGPPPGAAASGFPTAVPRPGPGSSRNNRSGSAVGSSPSTGSTGRFGPTRRPAPSGSSVRAGATPSGAGGAAGWGESDIGEESTVPTGGAGGAEPEWDPLTGAESMGPAGGVPTGRASVPAWSRPGSRSTLPSWVLPAVLLAVLAVCVLVVSTR
jgi:hypothetical protein